MQPILEIKQLNLSLGQRDIVKNVSFTLYKSEVVALLGESGSGKTTIANAILQLHSHTLHAQGTILFNQINLLAQSEKELQRIRGKEIGMVFQDPMTSLNPTMKIGKQISEALRWHYNISKNEAKIKSIELLHSIGISDPHLRIDYYPYQLSGGMRQRVLIAMALACHPKILIADEPTSALDVVTQIQILNLLKEIRHEHDLTILLITHDLDVVRALCDRVIIMRHGEIVESGNVATLYQSPSHPYTQELLSYVR